VRPHLSRDQDHRLCRRRVTLEHAQQITAHESPKTTKLYNATSDQISLDEVARIVIGNDQAERRQGVIPSIQDLVDAIAFITGARVIVAKYRCSRLLSCR
jgi:hypothetical protein